MPHGDSTGPMGEGPMTGRAMGYCAGYDMPGFMNPGPGWGQGRGRGGRYGFRHRYYATGLTGWQRGQPRSSHWEDDDLGENLNASTVESQRAARIHTLKARAARLEAQLGRVNERLSRLEAD